ncbi:hypothetical protein EVAR_97090_1 [Eumeta japonica]|uniref:Uncharacterized protein n=1 Tax=Eumeta variegata TaxID=151549 RepID=A0A4C1X8X9_EUMVA|nr:hypothetical protein EVAR_97090_1 [Eumeta japonica]
MGDCRQPTHGAITANSPAQRGDYYKPCPSKASYKGTLPIEKNAPKIRADDDLPARAGARTRGPTPSAGLGTRPPHCARLSRIVGVIIRRALMCIMYPLRVYAGRRLGGGQGRSRSE